MILFTSSCTLSNKDQLKLDQFPECETSKYRLNKHLTLEEFKCITRKESDLNNQINQYMQRKQAEQARKEKNRLVELEQKEIAKYEDSKEGKADLSMCNILIGKALVGIDYISFSIGHYSKSDDKFLSCTALVKYPSLTGYQIRSLSVIYNENNKVMQMYYR